MNGGTLPLLTLLVSWTSLLLHSAALVHLQRQRASCHTERLAGHGYVRTAACRVTAASVYSAVALLDVLGVRIPGAGVLGPEALMMFTGVQGLWLFNTGMDIWIRHRLQREKPGPGGG